jgi:thioredoxin 1
MTNIVIADSDAKFQQILSDAGNRPVLVDFFAEWCGPCKMMAPALQAFADSHPEVLVVKADVDHAQDAAVSYGVRGVPTLELVRNGKSLGKRVGAQGTAQLTAFVEQALKA